MNETLYAIVGGEWKYGDPKTLTLKSVTSTAQAQISLLGQTGELPEYRPQIKPQASFTQTPEGLKLTAWKARRLYTNNQWPNPIVIKLTNVKSGVTPPKIETLAARWDAAAKAVILEGRLDDLGKAATVEAGFQHRVRPEATEFTSRPRTAPALTSLVAPGVFKQEIDGLSRSGGISFRRSSNTRC
jgi:alpha-L-fucosidase